MPIASRFNRVKTANIFGALGYTNLVIQWLWAVLAVGLPYFQASRYVDTLFGNNTTPKPILPPPVELGDSTPSSIVVIVVLIFSVAAIAYAIWAIPRSLGKTGAKITKSSAIATSDVIIKLQRHQKTQKDFDAQKVKMVIRISWLLKIGLIIVPVLLLLIPQETHSSISRYSAVLAGLFFACFSLLWFSLQFLISKLLRLDQSKVW